MEDRSKVTGRQFPNPKMYQNARESHSSSTKKASSTVPKKCAVMAFRK